MPPVKKIRNATNILMELRKICQHPYLSAPEMENEADPEDKQHKELFQSSGKLAFLKILLPKLKAKGHRVLLFSQFKIALDRIQDFLHGEGYNFLRLDGDAPQAQRQKDMDAFNAPDSEFFIFLLTTRAGGVGINLATADTVIVFDPDFNPHQDLQAIARSHRYGQHKKVLVFKLMTKDSVEEQIIQKGKAKMVLDHLVVQNLGKDGGEEADVDSMLLHGAKALYETNADGTSATDVTYTSKQVDEMIDKVEKQADEEAKALQEKWEKEDNMTEEEKLQARQARTVETMDFSFAKIWETDRADLQDMGAVPEDDDDNMQVDLQMIRTAAEEAREREKARELERDRKDRRKHQKVDYRLGSQDTPKKKASGTNKKRKSESLVRSSQGSDGEFQIDPQDEISAFEDEEAGMDAVPEHHPDLSNLPDNRGSDFHGLRRQVKELRKMERKAIEKRMAALAEQAARERGVAVEGPPTSAGATPRLPTPPAEDGSHAALAHKASKAQKREEKVKAERRRLEQQMKDLMAAKQNAQAEPSAPAPPVPQQAQTAAQSRSQPQAPPPAQDRPHAPLPSPPVTAPPHANGIAGPSRPPPPAPAPTAGPSRIPHPPPQSQPPSQPQRPTLSLVDVARISQDIVEARDAFQRMWQDLCRFNMVNEQGYWAIMVYPSRYWNERSAIYSSLSVSVDGARMRVGEPAFYTNPVVQGVVRTLFGQNAHGLSGDSPMRQQPFATASHPHRRPSAQMPNGHAYPAPYSNGHHPFVPMPMPTPQPQPQPQTQRPVNIAQPARRSTSPVKAAQAPPRPVVQISQASPAPQIPTNVTQPQLRPQPQSTSPAAPKRSVDTSSARSRPSKIASPAAPPPPSHPTSLHPSASVASASSRGTSPGPRPLGPSHAGNSSQLSPVKTTSESLPGANASGHTADGHAKQHSHSRGDPTSTSTALSEFNSAVSNPPAAGQAQSTTSQPATPQRPTWATINSPATPTARAAQHSVPSQPVAGPSRGSPVLHAPPPPPPPATTRCPYCQQTSHAEADCPMRTEPRALWAALQHQTAVLARRVQDGGISEQDRVIQQKRIEELQQRLQRHLGTLGRTTQVPNGSVTGQASRPPGARPQSQGIEGSSKDHAIAIDDDDDDETVDEQPVPPLLTSTQQPARPNGVGVDVAQANNTRHPLSSHSTNGHVPIPAAAVQPAQARPPTQPATPHINGGLTSQERPQPATRAVPHSQSIFAPGPSHPPSSRAPAPLAGPAPPVSAPAPAPKRRGCPVCVGAEQHDVQHCPAVRAGPTSVRNAIARMPSDHPTRKLLENALATVKTRQTAQAPAVAPAPASASAPVPAPPVNGSSNTTTAAGLVPAHAPRVDKCPMCRQPCGRSVKACAEALGGRKALKDRIRKLDTERDMSQAANPALQSLYDCYKLWPRDEDGTPRKKIKREH